MAYSYVATSISFAFILDLSNLGAIDDTYEYFSNLDQHQVNVLAQEVLHWDEVKLQPAKDVLKDYYSLDVPYNLIKQILSKNIILAYECYTNGIRDTGEREMLIDSLLKEMGMRSWPINGEGDAVFESFCSQLKEKMKLFGIQKISTLSFSFEKRVLK